MERTINHASPSAPEVPSEQFVITEVATGKQFILRELTDEQVSKHLHNTIMAHREASQNVLKALNQAEYFAKLGAVLTFEQERRQKTIAVVGDLNTVSGLRKQ